MKTSKTILIAIGSFGCGFLLCWSFNPSSQQPSSEKTSLSPTSKPHATNIPRQKKFADHASNIASLETEPNKLERETVKIVRIPLSLTNSVLPLHLDNSESELSELALIPYGLTQLQNKKLVNFLNDKAKQIAQIEADCSEILANSEGQFIKIKSFAEQGESLKKEIEAEIQLYFKDAGDDRGEIFKKQLFRTLLYDDFGATEREISIDDSVGPGGDPNKPGKVFTIARYQKGKLVSIRSDPLSLSLMQGRFGSILEKHKSQLIPQ